MKEQKNKKSETGITLIALVVSIIVLIILAGVSIAMNGKIMNLGIGENCNISASGVAISSMAGVLYNNSKIVNCYNVSDIEVGRYSGGIVGSIHTNSKINNCYNIGNINSEKNYDISVVGGVAGVTETNSTIENSFNKGNINGQNNVGGITGENVNNIQIQNCYNTGNISGYNKIGGISGQNTCEISNCYNIGLITGTTLIGGITGQNLTSTTYNTIGIIKNSYSLENVVDNLDGGNNNAGIIENSLIKTEQEMKSLAKTLGSAFKEDTNNINNGYPILAWQ